MDAIETEAVAAIRRFNRFHTRWVGALGGSRHSSGLSLADAQVLHELAQRDDWQAAELAKALDLDPAYLSRILRRFATREWLDRSRSSVDGRAWRLQLTDEGRAAFAALDGASDAQARSILSRLPLPEQADLVDALATTQRLLSGERQACPRPTIREHRPGDIGWVIAAHGRLYAEEYGWDQSFEALVAEIAAKFLREFKPDRERCFIAELEGMPAGSSFVVEEDEETAKLRLSLVEKRAQGLGLGKALVRDAVDFARRAGYRRMALWTNDILHAARAIYVAEGFRLVAEERLHSFGQDLVGQNWELVLRPEMASGL
ncbi:GNAT family N-acetyltransferase [Bosea sp. RAF48]|uniref:bifunctional helix-turn-helix transcriptional regulator/GNAT family N-acetyltransferase n=1 Tax=Bosea sp. RAF48 TaxID=3237480 RepID=UPI003F939774